MRDMEALTGPPSATVRPDIRPPGMGACTCPPGTLYAGCRCGWGTMIDRMLQLGYGRNADPVTIARDSVNAADAVADQYRAARKRALTVLGRSWTDSGAALARLLGITPQALKDFAPNVWQAITDRRGTTGITRGGRPAR